MIETTTGAVRSDGPGDGLTDAEKLAAIETYQKALKPLGEALRARVTEDMGVRRVERVGAFLPDGTKLAAVGYSGGRKTARVNDTAAALAWCLKQHPEEIVEAINPAFLKVLLDVSRAKGEVGEHGVDPHTGEELPFIDIVQGNPYVSVTTTKEGVERMQRLALGFAAMLEGPTPEAAPAPEAPVFPTNDPYDPALADRLENGAYRS